MTYSSKSYIEKKTGPHGIGRLKYLQTLVTEFQDTHLQGYYYYYFFFFAGVLSFSWYLVQVIGVVPMKKLKGEV